jgi:hypothetical protein
MASRDPLPPTRLSPLRRLWLAEAVRLTEAQAGPLDDAEASRRARAAGGALDERILARAEGLARRDGLIEAQQAWLDGARLAGVLWVLAALVVGAGLAWGALGDGRQPVNLFWALGGMLGLHLLTLAAWLVGLAWSGGGGLLGRLWLQAATRLSRDARGAQLGPALAVLLGRQRLGRWALGIVVHAWWCLALLAALGTLVLMLSLRRYGFTWETTLLSPQAVAAWVDVLGSVPARLGFALPEAEVIAASGERVLADAGVRQAWASWLLGAVLAYGLLPRMVALAGCAAAWARGRRKLGVDLRLPGYALLHERLMPSHDRLGVVDPAPRDEGPAAARVAVAQGQGTLVLGLELADHPGWPTAWPPGVENVGVIDEGAQRRRLLERLASHPARRLLVGIDPRRSPDRGSLAFLDELHRSAHDSRVWLLPAPADECQDAARLADWREALARLSLTAADTLPLGWLEGHDD